MGSPDIFMNILTTNGLVGRFVTEWVGAEAFLKSVKIKLGMPNYSGDTMKMTGEVVDKRIECEQQLITIAVKSKNSMGYHVTGTVTVALS